MFWNIVGKKNNFQIYKKIAKKTEGKKLSIFFYSAADAIFFQSPGAEIFPFPKVAQKQEKKTWKKTASGVWEAGASRAIVGPP